MKKLKQAAATVVAAAVTAGSLAGCSSTDYAMTANGKKINAGVYINFILNEMSNQMYTMYYNGEITDMSECFDKEIDGKDFKTYVKDSALEQTKEFAAVTAKFDELGLELSDEDVDEIKDSVDQAWDQSGEYYENEGVSKDSLTQCYEISYKRSALFDYYYAEGGVEEVSDDDLQSYVNENYIRYKTIYVAKSTNEDEDAAAEEDKATEELLDQYIAEAEGLDFAGFDTIIDEYNTYQEEQAAAEEEAEAETETESEDDAVTELDSSSETDETSDTDDSAADEETTDSESADETDAETDTSSTEDEETEEETDPYENETVLNYNDYTDSESDSYSETYASMLNAFKNAEYETATLYESDDYYYLFMTADIAERTDYVEENKDTLLQSMKGDDFDALVEEWVKALDITLNDKAIKRYTVQEVYDRQNEYYNENG